MSLSFYSLVSMLVTSGVVIRRYIQVEIVLQLPLQGLERRTILFVLLPAFQHNVMHDFGAAGGARHPVALGNPLDHLVVRHGWKDQMIITTYQARNNDFALNVEVFHNFDKLQQSALPCLL